LLESSVTIREIRRQGKAGRSHGLTLDSLSRQRRVSGLSIAQEIASVIDQLRSFAKATEDRPLEERTALNQ
jgi:hypothetical protein